MLTPRGRVKELSRQENRPRTFRARLAEDYDGIGQFVLVRLSGGSTAGAFKAHVAAADFGTNQIIPVGTIITVMSVRGRVEIISLGAK